MNFEAKYKKYKQKYLELQEQIGGHLLNPEGYVLDKSGYGKILIRLDDTTPNEIFERPILYQAPNMFINYRPTLLNPGIFELSNSFVAVSAQIFGSIVEHIRVLPENSWIMCIRYTNKDGSLSDCQIGVSGAVNLVDTPGNGIIDLKQSVAREIEEESGLRIINSMVCGEIKTTTDLQNNLTYIVSRVDIVNAEIVSLDNVRAPAEKRNDMPNMKVWCVPHLTNDEFILFKDRLNASEIKNLNITERNIASLVFIRKENLLVYIDHSLTNPPIERRVESWSSARHHSNEFYSGSRRTDTRPTFKSSQSSTRYGRTDAKGADAESWR